MTTTTKNTQDLHIVVAALGGNLGDFVGYTAVSAPLAWDAAITAWEERERSRGKYSAVQGRKGLPVSHVLHYAVRSVADPRFAPLIGRGYADARDRKDPSRRSSYGDSGRVKAAKAWAKLYGYSGGRGGWIYNPANAPYIQGWESFAETLRRTNRIAQGADGLWYVIDRELVN